MVVLVYLDWPERCFRANEDDLRYLRSLLPRGAKVVSVRSDRAFLAALPQATHVITWHFKPEWYRLAPKLALVATPAAGRELVAPPPSPLTPNPSPLTPHPSPLTPNPSPLTPNPSPLRLHYGGFHGAIISETVLAFVLAYAHGFFATKPLWPRSLRAADVIDVAGTTAVIAGYGRIGKAIAARLSAFGVSVRGLTHAECDRLKGKVGGRGASFSALRSSLKLADWFILALPSDTGTDDFLDAELLSALSKKCVVINVGRGNAIDERALLSALRRGRIAAAYLDVFRHEPTVLAKGRTKLTAAERASDLASLSAAKLPRNLIRTPHGSAFSPSYVKAAFKELKDEKLI